MGAREYDPRTARWLQRDPNLYRYAGNDPINRVDPDGTEWDYHDLLDVAGFTPGLGEVADLANAIGYTLEGDWTNAGISAAGMLPGGDALKTGRLAKKVVKEVVEAGGEQVAKREAMNTLQEQGKKHANMQSELKRVREEYSKREARENSGKYSEEDLKRVRKGKAPIRDGEPMHLHRKKPLSEVGSNCPDNLEQMTAQQHRERHKKQGDFSRWGKKVAEHRGKRR